MEQLGRNSWELNNESGSSKTTFASSTSKRRSLANVPVRQHEVSDKGEESLQVRTRSLQDIYNTTNEVHVVCLLTDSEDVNFEEAMMNEKWKKAMDEEIAAIEHNNTWELSELVTKKVKYKNNIVYWVWDLYWKRKVDGAIDARLDK